MPKVYKPPHRRVKGKEKAYFEFHGHFWSVDAVKYEDLRKAIKVDGIATDFSAHGARRLRAMPAGWQRNEIPDLT